MVAKKWFFMGMFTLLSLSVAVAAPPAVHPETGEPLIVTCFRGTPVIDGDLSDWNLAAMTPAVVDAARQVYTGQTLWSDASDCSGQFYLMWDNTNIYIAAIVKDDALSMNKTDGNIWNADCVEVFLGTTELGTSASDHTQHYQFGFNANDQIWNWCNMDSAGQSRPNFMVSVASRTPDGYICEVAIEHARLADLDFTAGNTLGFHPCIDDTEAADREGQITWTGREAHDQSLGFGYLILSAEPAVAKELAQNPGPADKAADVPITTALSWKPGEFAVGHDVYFGTAMEDVNNASRASAGSVLLSQGQADATYDPAGTLEYGQTYYWRIDEVNAAPDSTIFKGQVWSFTAEPFSYPVTPVAATASSAQPGMGPENTINGSGLNDSDQHSTELTHMWMSTSAQPHWVQYEFDRAYKLDKMMVWNSNQLIEAFLGFGAKTVTIEYSTDGATWTTLEGVSEFAKATSSPTYAANTTVDFGGVTARFVKLSISANWGGMTAQTGLSEVRFFSIPVQAFEPQPALAAAGVAIDTELAWRPGREAESHQVYLGTDENAMALVKTTAEQSASPGSLNFGTTYFWKVDEVGGAGPYAGEVWTFTTQEYATIDDMESYNDDDNRIYDSWVDGLTDSAKGGSQVGYDVSPFAERKTIHGGKQAMPLIYDNSAAPFISEAERTFDAPQNWAVGGADSLSLWVQNAPADLYVTVQDSAGKSATATKTSAGTPGQWTQWTIPFSDLAGVNLSRVKKLTIGVGNKATPVKGGAGTLFLDDLGYGKPAP